LNQQLESISLEYDVLEEKNEKLVSKQQNMQQMQLLLSEKNKTQSQELEKLRQKAAENDRF
jgi:hypothetical protein